MKPDRLTQRLVQKHESELRHDPRCGRRRQPNFVSTEPEAAQIANFKSQYSSAWNYTMAASTIVSIPMLVLFMIFQKQIMESIKTSGLK